MPDLDQRIRSGLDRLSAPVEPQDAFERIAAKKRRRRMMHRAQTTLVPFVALVVAAASTFGLVRAFHRSPPATTSGSPSGVQTAPATTPTPGVPSDAVLLKEIGPACDVSKVTGDFDGDGLSDVAFVYFAPPPGADCGVPPEKRQYEAFISWASGGIDRIDLSSACGNADICRAFAAPDLNSDGKAELAVQHGVMPAVLDFWTFLPTAHIQVESGGPQNVAGAQPLTLVWGAGDGHMDRIECVAGASPSIVAVSSQMDAAANEWRADETAFRFDGPSRVVLQPTTHRSGPADGPVPELEPGTRICGAPAGGEDLHTSSK